MLLGAIVSQKMLQIQTIGVNNVSRQPIIIIGQEELVSYYK